MRGGYKAEHVLEQVEEHERWEAERNAERRRLGLVFWSRGHGWRLHKDYQERLEAEACRLAAVDTTPEGA